MHPERFKVIANAPRESLTIYRGVEKEGLRVNGVGCIAQDDHPKELGSALKHPYITTDYSEALLEFVTPVETDPEQALAWLQNLQSFSVRRMGEQVIWPGSMPCRIDHEEQVRIAHYGTSNVGRLKEVYRHGLWHRYGRVMQSIAGLHYNVSFEPSLMAAMADMEGVEADREWISAQYFHVIRNFRRHQYLLAHLFGASPAYDQTFRVGSAATFPTHGQRSHLLESATSLRMSDIGYTNQVQSQYYVCFNALLSFVSTIDEAMNTSHPAYEAIGVRDGAAWNQLNTNVLQIENEYYSDIRPKRVARSGERPSHALLERGVEYIEVRCMDLNPFAVNGIDLETMRFLDLFLLWCWVKKSPFLARPSCDKLKANQLRTAKFGRDGHVVLDRYGAQSTIKEWGRETLERMRPLAELLEHRYPGTIASLKLQQERIAGREETLAQRLVRQMQESQDDHIDFMGKLAASHRAVLLNHGISPNIEADLEAATQKSIEAQRLLEASDTVSFERFVQKWT